MLRTTVWLLVGVCGFVSCDIKCPDGNTCPDRTTCCRTSHGYSCCPYPDAVCCADLSHCCPPGYRCNIVTQMCEKLNQPWMTTPMVKKEAAEKPSTPVLPISHLQELEKIPDQNKASVHCDNFYTCPDGTTCCRHPTGAWFCCPLSPARCCLDGYHCCAYGYDCDATYTHCIRQGLRYPFTPKKPLSSVPASLISTSEDQGRLQETPLTALTEANDSTFENGVIRCDSKFYCPSGQTCCKKPTGQWGCCPYPLGSCCTDGQHCCEYGYTCDPKSTSCRGWYSRIPSGTHDEVKPF